MEKITKENWFNIIAGIMLILAIPTFWPYIYFQILRWVITVVAIYNAYEAHELNKKEWVYIMGAVVILFNPIFPFFFSKQIWIILDLVTSVIMFISFDKINIDNEYIKFIQEKEQEINARKAATSAFEYIMEKIYRWPVESYEGIEREQEGQSYTYSKELGYEATGVISKELVDSLLKGTLASDNPEKTQYWNVQENFNQRFTSWQHTTESNAKDNFYSRRKRVFIISILALSVVLIASHKDAFGE